MAILSVDSVLKHLQSIICPHRFAAANPSHRESPMKASFRRFTPVVLAAAFAAGAAWAQRTELLVYTALETDQLKAYTESFAKHNPTIELKFVRDSTGVITAKLLAEKANPQAD